MDRIKDAVPWLTPSERRIAEAVLDDPDIVAFGTVAQVATRSGSSGPTVLRFASKVGFDGFLELQQAVQGEIADQLRPATQRIRERHNGDFLASALVADLENVRRTLEGVDPDDFAAVVELVADRRHRVFVISSELSGAAGRVFAQQLDMLRDGVVSIDGNAPRVSQGMIGVEDGDVVLVFDLRRYERWVVRAARRADERGGYVVAVTDSRQSSLASVARIVVEVSARGVGPFDSAAGSLALVHALVAAAAARMRRSAAARLDAIESEWLSGDDLSAE
mgnify:CR=1 FL=1